MKKLELTLYGNPDVDVREGEQGDTDDDTKDKKKFPLLPEK